MGSTNEETQAKKRLRARQSCDSCRQRKTRCNADDTFPCSTCTSLGVDCHLSKRRKRGPMPAAYVEALEDRIKRLEQTLSHHGMSECSDTGGDGQQASLSSSSSPSSSRSASSSPAAANATEILSHYNTTLYIGRSSGYYTLDQEAFATDRRRDTDCEVEKAGNDEQDDHLLLTSEQPSSDPAPSRRSGEKGGSIPSCRQRRFEPFKDIPNMTVGLADALIELYFRYIHPTAPFINKIAFLEQYYFQNPQLPDKYLLYSVCSVAGKYLAKEKEMLAKHNISVETMYALNQQLYARAEKVLETVFRRSSINTVSALILLASFSPTNDQAEQDDDRLQWFMVGTAQDLGLHRSSTRWRLPEHEIELRRRVWYSVYGVDREMSASLGRPLTILDGDFDVEMPSPYEIGSSYDRDTRDVDDDEPVPKILLEAERDLQEKRPIYGIFSYYIPCSRMFGRVLGELYSTNVPSIEVAKKLSDEVDVLSERTSKDLSAVTTHDLDPANFEFMIAYHQFLKLIIHRCFISDRDVNNIDFALHSLSVCTLSAISIIDSVEKMEAIGPSSMPWSYISYVIFQTAIIFLFHAKSDNNFLRQLGARNLARCANIYLNDEELRDSRPAKMLMSLAAKYSVAMESSSNDPEVLATTTQQDHALLESAAASAANASGQHESAPPAINQNLPPNATSDMPYSAPPAMSMQTYPSYAPSPLATMDSSQQQPPSSVMVSTQHQPPMHLTAVPTDEFNTIDVQFDAAGLSSELALWEFPTAMTWNEWDPYL
ncbi:hypothetical protein O0I10_010094 [Lichtheimia ornata]|uniref:Zn(2)-C6 fungal-type domain-containing protein n=1 Tax=Lichtheimia ornata TaxID=688661 RepID=A0AAD7UX44_9FUNG|nr:uncharacterized protein O0I10_010094 [Lichtheimia ornata]KAJ8654272.1 hypothetical protein O0I10_010094 [Lichtheimia ornata]